MKILKIFIDHETYLKILNAVTHRVTKEDNDGIITIKYVHDKKIHGYGYVIIKYEQDSDLFWIGFLTGISKYK